MKCVSLLNVFSLFLAGLLAATSIVRAADEGDSTTAELTKVKDEYRRAMGQARDDLLEAFAAEEKKLTTAAAKSEDKAQRSEQLKAEKQAFETDGVLPKSAALKGAVRIYQQKAARQQARCEKAFDAAIEKALRQDLAAAKALRDEKQKFFQAAIHAKPAATPGVVEAKPASDEDSLFQSLAEQVRAGDVLAAGDLTDQWLVKSGASGIDRLEAAVNDLASSYRQVAQRTAIIEVSLRGASRAVVADRFGVAKALHQSAARLGKMVKEPELTKRIQAATADVQAYEKAFERYQTALKSDVSDADAQTTIGAYLCLVKQDWSAGLLHWKDSGQEPWQAIAVGESQPEKSFHEKSRLGDLWSNAANSGGNGLRNLFRARAAYWQLQALPELTGEAELALMQRIESNTRSLPEILWNSPSGRGISALASVRDLRPTLNDDFRDPKSGFRGPQTKENGYECFYKSDRYVLHSWFGTNTWRVFHAPGIYRNAACLVTGRALGKGRDSWGIGFANANVRIRRDGEIEIFYLKEALPRIVIPPSTIVNPDDGWNTVFVLRRGAAMQLVINGSAVNARIELPNDNEATPLAIWSGQGEESQDGVYAEFRKLLTWPLD